MSLGLFRRSCPQLETPFGRVIFQDKNMPMCNCRGIQVNITTYLGHFQSSDYDVEGVPSKYNQTLYQNLSKSLSRKYNKNHQLS